MSTKWKISVGTRARSDQYAPGALLICVGNPKPCCAWNDLQRIYKTAQQDGADFNLAYIGSEFNYPHNEKFDPEYINRLFDHAYQLSVNGYLTRMPRSPKAAAKCLTKVSMAPLVAA
jgi:hypothetical protein